MRIHRGRFALAMIAVASLLGCQSSNNNQAFWKTNPFASKTAAATAKPEYPAKPSTQVSNPAGANAPTAGGLAAKSSTLPSSPKYPGAATSFNAPSGTAGTTAPAYGSPAATGSTVDPMISAQRGPYSPSAYNSASRASSAGVGARSAGAYPSGDAASRYGAAPTSSGFKSGAKDYSSPATDYTASANTGSARSGAIIPRYGASADRYGTPTGTADRSAANGGNYSAGTDRYGAASPTAAGVGQYNNSGAHTGAPYDPIAAARNNSASAFGPTASAAGVTTSNARGGISDPFQPGNRTSPYGTPNAAGALGADRGPGVYSNPYASTEASRSASPANDRTGTPNYRDFPASGVATPREPTNANASSGNFLPSNSRGGTRSGDYRSNATGPSPAAGNYQPGNTGYNPPTSDYRPGATGYSPPGTSSYRSPAAPGSPSATATDDPPPFRPGSTSDYAPRSGSPVATTASRDVSGPGADSGAAPSGYNTNGYNSGASGYLR